MPNQTHDDLSLTERQHQVAALIVQGHTIKEIASRLKISESTTKSHCTVLRQKFNVRTTRQLVPVYSAYMSNGSSHRKVA